MLCGVHIQRFSARKKGTVKANPNPKMKWVSDERALAGVHFFIITPMLGTPSLVRDDRIKVEKRCMELLCFDENVALAARVFTSKREKT